MAIRNQQDAGPPPADAAVPPPVADGYDDVQSLGRLVDEMMRHSKDGAAINVQPLGRLTDPGEGDPEPIAPPEPVPDGDDLEPRGADREGPEAK